MDIKQQAFLEKLALRIPRLFDVIRQGHIKSEYIIGVRRIGQRQVRLALVAEVVDPGIAPLSSHGAMKSVDAGDQVTAVEEPASLGDMINASARRRPRKR